MAKLGRPSRSTVLNGLIWTAASVVGLQTASIMAVVAVDELRKRREPPSGSFPSLKPQTAQVSDSDVTVYTNGHDLYEDQLRAIRGAKQNVFFECYIVKADEIGYAFRRELIKAARRGVQVHVILDMFGNLNQDPRYRHFPKIDNLHVIRFPLVRLGILTGRAKDTGRDHRKVLTVDGEIGFVGGYNIGTLYANHWRDTHVRVVGPQVWDLENSFVDMWNMFRKRNQPMLPDQGAHEWSPRLRAVTNTPAFKLFPVRASYLDAIDRATERVWITMGYFIPDEGFLHSLVSAAKRGVDVRVLIPQYSNHILADWVGRPHYSALLNGGVRIFLYREAMVHAKTMTVDGRWSTVGTTNIDRLSMAGNYEINLELFDTDFAAIMERVFNVDMSNSIELDRDVWEMRPSINRVVERVLRPLAPLL